MTDISFNFIILLITSMINVSKLRAILREGEFRYFCGLDDKLTDMNAIKVTIFAYTLIRDN